MRQWAAISILFVVFSCATKTQVVKLNPAFVPEENNSHSFSVPYELDGNTAITRLGEYEIVFPEHFQARDTAFGSQYFTGHPGAMENAIGLLIANRKSGWPKVYVDYNNNLDFSDDGDPLEFSAQDSTVVLTLRRKDNPAATFPVKYTLPNDDPENYEHFEKLFNRDGHVKAGIPMLEARYWFFTQRLNNHLSQTTINGDSAKLALHDYDCNGYYDDVGADLIFAAPVRIEFTSFRTSGAFALQDDSTLFAFKDQVYEITQVDSLGRSLSFRKSELPFEPPIAPGQKIPDYEFELLEGRDTSLATFINGDKYLLIDAWGSWCKGCHSSAPDLLELSEQYKDKLQIVGLNTGEPEEKIKAFAEQYGHHWPQGMLHSKITDELRIDSYPTYILIDPQGQIISLKTHPRKVEEMLAESN